MRSPQSPASPQPLVQAYLNYLAFERRYSANTCAAVARDLGLLGENPAALNEPGLKSLLARRHADGLSPRSLARMASSWRGFYGFLVREGHLQNSPAETLKTPRSGKALPKALSVDQVMALLEGGGATDFQACQSRVLIELLYGTGLRISEALSLQTPGAHVSAMSSLDLNAAQLRVLGKGSKTRVVPLIESLRNTLLQFLECRQRHLTELNMPDSAALFLSSKGQPLTVRMAQHAISKYARQKGLSQHLHPHMLRHSFGSHVLQGSQNLRGVQELLGHASIASTQVYTALDFAHLSAVYDKAFPRAK
ncbi:tyrosine recombinase XerC [Limnobacter humi]|uniref:Tyrosine recombinase XerC n=1 Tax=Limnobacter humi TaxID=1778671 RepID=A0ABT1WBC9_9BURK|nr:tyrosine recombinase XerC [Limnobacter humi]MCQ8894825.1 tyrosine recombinase XerC [Limnobacter humi]